VQLRKRRADSYATSLKSGYAIPVSGPNSKSLRSERLPGLCCGNFYEEVGIFVKRGIIEGDIALDLWSAQVQGAWAQMAPAIAIVRRRQGPSVWENFEYLVTLGEDWYERFPNGTLPRARRRKFPEDVWLAEDTRIEQQE